MCRIQEEPEACDPEAAVENDSTGESDTTDSPEDDATP
jgi:hypothetical protein